MMKSVVRIMAYFLLMLPYPDLRHVRSSCFKFNILKIILMMLFIAYCGITANLVHAADWETLRPDRAKTVITINKFVNSTENSHFSKYGFGKTGYMEIRNLDNNSGDLIAVLYENTGRDDIYIDLTTKEVPFSNLSGMGVHILKEGKKDGFLGEYEYTTMTLDLGHSCLGLVHLWDRIFGAIARGSNKPYRKRLSILYCNFEINQSDIMSYFNEITAGIGVAGYKVPTQNHPGSADIKEPSKPSVADGKDIIDGNDNIKQRLKKLKKLEDEG